MCQPIFKDKRPRLCSRGDDITSGGNRQGAKGLITGGERSAEGGRALYRSGSWNEAWTPLRRWWVWEPIGLLGRRLPEGQGMMAKSCVAGAGWATLPGGGGQLLEGTWGFTLSCSITRLWQNFLLFAQDVSLSFTENTLDVHATPSPQTAAPPWSSSPGCSPLPRLLHSRLMPTASFRHQLHVLLLSPAASTHLYPKYATPPPKKLKLHDHFFDKTCSFLCVPHLTRWHSIHHSTSAAAAAAAKSLQSCPTLCDPVDGSPPGSPIPRILQARTLEWVAISLSTSTQYLFFPVVMYRCESWPIKKAERWRIDAFEL